MEVDDVHDESMDNMQVKLKYSNKSLKKAPVFLADFSNSHLKFGSSNLKFKSYRCVNDSENHTAKRILVADNGRLKYSATNFDQDFNERNLCSRYLVGIRSKSTGKMKICDSILFHLKPVTMQSDDEAKVVDESEKSFRDQLNELTKSFGSKNKKRAMSTRVKYDVQDADTTLRITEALQSLPVESADMDKSKSDHLDYIPERNTRALTAADVYSIDDIITSEEIPALKAAAEVLEKASPEEIQAWKAEKKYCNYVMHHLESDFFMESKAKYLLYYQYLLLFMQLKYNDFKKLKPIVAIPEPFLSSMLERFTTRSDRNGKIQRSLSVKMKDKLLAYAMVLALFIDDFSISLNLIANDVKPSLTKLTSIAQVLGCHVKIEKSLGNTMKTAQLTLPLFVPPKKYTKYKKT